MQRRSLGFGVPAGGLATGAYDSTVRLWEVASGRLLWRWSGTPALSSALPLHHVASPYLLIHRKKWALCHVTPCTHIPG